MSGKPQEISLEDAITTLEGSLNTLVSAMGQEGEPGPSIVGNVERILAVSAQLDYLTTTLG